MYGNERPLLNNYSARAGPAASYRARQIIGHGNELDDRTLRRLLDCVQRKLLERRGGMKTTLVVHGGVVSVLGYGFRSRTTDVDAPDEDSQIVRGPSRRPRFTVCTDILTKAVVDERVGEECQ